MYHPEADSYLMSRILKEKIPELLDAEGDPPGKKNPDLKFLEIGAGSGIHLETAFNAGIKKQNIFSCDIDSKSVEHCNTLGFNCIHSDLFENIEDKYDLIIFNPPYLPEHEHDKESDTSGGKKGNEIINKFLGQAKSHLDKNGKIILLTSSLTKGINWNNYKKKLLGKKKLFFEELYVWELTA